MNDTTVNSENVTRKIIIGILCVTILIFLDQITKFWAVHTLKNAAPIIIWNGVFELNYLENHGAAFGILQGQKWPLVIFTVVVLAAIVYIYLKRIPDQKRFRWLNVILILFSAGAIGNFIDRIAQDYVVDFFYFVLIDFPIFNIADIYVVIAACLLLVLGLFYYKEDDFEQIIPSHKRNS